MFAHMFISYVLGLNNKSVGVICNQKVEERKVATEFLEEEKTQTQGSILERTG